MNETMSLMTSVIKTTIEGSYKKLLVLFADSFIRIPWFMNSAMYKMKVIKLNLVGNSSFMFSDFDFITN